MSIGSFTGDMPQEQAEVSIRIGRNKMEAYLIYDSENVTRSQIETVLDRHNIIYGIREEVIEKAVSIRLAGEPLFVARGTEPVNGEDARVEFLLKSGGTPGRPRETFDGRVDFYNLDLIRNVEEGQVIAVKYPPTPGVAGCTVTGEEIPPKPGKDVQLSGGKNVLLLPGEETGNPEASLAVVAAIAGHVVVVGNQINVSKIYEVPGDVDLNTGNLEFKGTVVVTGSVREGFRVTAEGDVVVMGTVSDAVIECGGSLSVKNGIVGMKTRVRAKGSVFARFVENAAIDCGEDVVVGDAILHSRISAVKSVKVNGKGVIAGGVIRAGEEISCNIAGSGLATATELEAGISPELRDEYTRLNGEISEAEKNYDKAEKALVLLKRIQESGIGMTSDKQALLLQVTRVQVHLSKELKLLRESLKKVEEMMQHSERGRISVQGTINPGVKVTIGSMSVQIKDPYPYVSLTNSGGEIRFSPYK